MTILCDTCEKDLSDCTCYQDLIDALGEDVVFDMIDKEAYFCRDCGWDMYGDWENNCDCYLDRL